MATNDTSKHEVGTAFHHAVLVFDALATGGESAADRVFDEAVAAGVDRDDLVAAMKRLHSYLTGGAFDV